MSKNTKLSTLVIETMIKLLWNYHQKESTITLKRMHIVRQKQDALDTSLMWTLAFSAPSKETPSS
jgi:hypothetical protein